jgi:NADH-quinone oxidoreductase subunit A
MTDLTLHLLVFCLIGGGLLLAPLILGRLIRPSKPTRQKSEVYECGEPTVGSSLIQFDLRFYVVALLFIVFDVELVFFFPWSAVYGQLLQLGDVRLSEPERLTVTSRALGLFPESPANEALLSTTAAVQLSWLILAEMLVFLAVLVVGFAYVWKRGDLDWVRAVGQGAPLGRGSPELPAGETMPPVMAGSRLEHQPTRASV